MARKNNSQFESPRAFAKRGIKSEHAIRREMAAGRVPGFYSGNRFTIDSEAYIAQIKAECLRNAQGGVKP